MNSKEGPGKMKHEVILVICEAYKEVLDVERVNLEKSERIDGDTPIFGSNGYLDSLGLINLLLAVEEKVRQKFNVSISLVNERAMSQKNSPFKTIGTLADYIFSLLKENSSE